MHFLFFRLEPCKTDIVGHMAFADRQDGGFPLPESGSALATGYYLTPVGAEHQLNSETKRFTLPCN